MQIPYDSHGKNRAPFRNEKSAQRGSFWPDIPCGHPARNFGQALQILENKHFCTDMPRGRPRKNFGLKNFGLIFRSLTILAFFWEKDFGAISGGPFFSRPLCFLAECNTMLLAFSVPLFVGAAGPQITLALLKCFGMHF